jgi:hypothetical protein
MSDEPATTPDEPAVYIVAHTNVGGYWQGEAITAAHLAGGQDREVDIQRLLDLGAIVPASSEEAAAVRAQLAKEGTTQTPEGQPIDRAVPLPPLDPTHPDHPQHHTTQKSTSTRKGQ